MSQIGKWLEGREKGKEEYWFSFVDGRALYLTRMLDKEGVPISGWAMSSPNGNGCYDSILPDNMSADEAKKKALRITLSYYQKCAKNLESGLAVLEMSADDVPDTNEWGAL